jgi:hypothetical protein
MGTGKTDDSVSLSVLEGMATDAKERKDSWGFITLDMTIGLIREGMKRYGNKKN